MSIKQTQRLIILFLIAGLVTAILSCGDFNPNLNLDPGGVPKSSLSIPDALTVDGGSRAPSQDGVFSPFRAALDGADEILIIVNSYIDQINTIYIPDTYEAESGENYVKISTDSSRTYTRRINFSETADADPFLQINYTPGTTKGELYWKDADAAAGNPTALKVYYDASTSTPVLQGWLVVNPESSEPTYAKNLYFRASKSGDIITIEGGLAYHYTVAGNTEYTSDSESDRVYMFRSYTDAAGEKAAVALYFPKETVTSVTEDHDIQSMVIETFYDFYVGNGVSDFTTVLGATDPVVSDLSTFKTAVLSLDAANLGTDLAFLLDLENPIAYSTAGYVANGSPLPAGYTTGDLGNPALINFSLTPVQVAEITAASLAPLEN